MDCLFVNNLHVMISSQPDMDCKNWCINNIINCGGYTAYNTNRYPNRCYFKNKSCKNNLFNLEERTVFIAQGKFNQDELTILLCLILKQVQLQVDTGRNFYIEWSKNIGPFQLSATLKQGVPPEATDTRLLNPLTNDTCRRCIFKELHSTVQESVGSLVSQEQHSPTSSGSLVSTSCTVSSAINTSTVVH